MTGTRAVECVEGVAFVIRHRVALEDEVKLVFSAETESPKGRKVQELSRARLDLHIALDDLGEIGVWWIHSIPVCSRCPPPSPLPLHSFNNKTSLNSASSLNDLTNTK